MTPFRSACQIGGHDHGDASGIEHWTEREIDETAFKDARLGRRFGELLKKIGDGMGGSIPFACQDWANTKAAYRFFANERVEETDILSSHFTATRTRYDDCKGPILLIKPRASTLLETPATAPQSDEECEMLPTTCEGQRGARSTLDKIGIGAKPR
ncbi:MULTISPECIES: IS4/Tn5 family transposase DNA-binding protein [unclassified Bradyrhizobium]